MYVFGHLSDAQLKFLQEAKLLGCHNILACGVTRPQEGQLESSQQYPAYLGMRLADPLDSYLLT
jgi:hypothetical protein